MKQDIKLFESKKVRVAWNEQETQYVEMGDELDEEEYNIRKFHVPLHHQIIYTQI